MFAPADHILVHKPTTEFEGVRLNDPNETRKLPLGFVLGLHARKFTLDENRVRRGDKIERFTIIGDGPTMPALREQAARLGVSGAVQFTGWVEHRDVPGIARRSSVFLFPSVR